jgi:tetratricopeptide (TPR) repeat protein
VWRLAVLLAAVAWLAAAGWHADAVQGAPPASVSSCSACVPPAAHDAGETPASQWIQLSLGYSLTALERRLFVDAGAAASVAAGRLDEFPLLDAALVASGVDDPLVLAHYRRQWGQLVDVLKRSGAVRGAPRQQARAIFEFLHARVLTGGYSLPCTDLREAIDRGRFNCVSASVLFQCLAGEFGLEVCGLEAPGHVMSRLRTAGGPLDIETTCPRWFQGLDSPRAEAGFRAAGPTGQASPAAPTAGPATPWVPQGVPAREVPEPLATCHSSLVTGPVRPREVSDVELLAMIYYNRGVDLLGEKRFAEAAAANAKALRLAPDNATARGNLLVTLNNWAIELGAAAHYAEAAELLRLGLAIEPGYQAFRLNYAHLHRQWARQLDLTPPAP